MFRAAPDGNWTWRCSEEMLSTPGFHSLLELTKKLESHRNYVIRKREKLTEAA